MSNVEKDNLFEEVVNENAGGERVEVRCDHCGDSGSAEQAGKRIGVEPEGAKARAVFWEEVKKASEREHRRIRVREFFRALVEIGGYAALGGVMLAAQLLGIVSAWAAVPVFTVSWIWSAIRMDRFFRR